MAYKYRLYATPAAFQRYLSQISGRMGVLIRHFSMTNFPMTKQKALTFILNHGDDWTINGRKAGAIASALTGIAVRFTEPWQDMMKVYYLINILKRHYA